MRLLYHRLQVFRHEFNSIVIMIGPFARRAKKSRALLVKNVFMIDIAACLILFLFQFEACCFGKFCDAIQDRLDACLFW